MSSRRPLTVLVGCLLVLASPLAAQIERAGFNGTVTDPSGAIVAGVSVKATAAATGQSYQTTTNAQGIYTLPGLPVDTYSLTFSHAGFATVRYDGLTLKVDQTAAVDAQLELAAATSEIQVFGTAPLLDRNSAEVAGVVGASEIENLPVNGRNWANLLVLAPLAVDDGGGNQRTIRFAGHGRDDNNYMFDGVDATGIQEQAQKSTTRLQVSSDAIEEYRVNSMLYSAEYGAGAGGQVDIVTKSGTNQYHGDLFEYFRNSALDSRSFLDIDTDPTVTGPTPVPPFRLNQFGGSFGGPIQKDKTFIFLNYEGVRQFRGQTLHGFVPSATFKAQVLATSPELEPIMAAYPAGQVSTCVGATLQGDPCLDIDEYTHLGDISIREDSGLIRFDHRFTERTSLFIRAVRDDSFTTAPLNNLFDQQQIKTHPANYIIALDHTFSPNVFNEFKFGLNRAPFHNPQVGAFNQNLAVNTDNFEMLNNDNTDNEVGTSFNYVDNLTIQHGRHSFRIGGEIRRVRLNQGITEDNSITFTDDASIINNQLNSFLLKSSWWSRGLRHTFVMPYFQDDWKVRPNLTLNLGIRWDYYAPITEAHGRSRIFDLQRCANAVPSDPGICPPGSAFFFPNHRNFDPRFGLAWAPERFHGKTVVRGGYGIYHGAGQNDDLNAGLESDNVRISLSSADVPNLSYPIDPFIPFAATVGRTPRALQRDRRDLYSESWGLMIQQELPGSFVLQTGYLGSVGHRLFARTYENVCLQPPDPSTGLCPRTLAGVASVDLKRNDGNSTFNAFQLSLQRRFTSGLSLNAQYLWSHGINDGSIGGGEANAPENVACRRCDRGPSVFDIHHNLVAATVYELPFGKGKHWVNSDGTAGKVLGEWQFSATQVLHTGHPLTVTVDRDASTIPNGNSSSDQRPDLVPGVPVIPANQGVNNWINPAAFAVPANGTFGNAGRGLVRSPLVWQTDMALSKTVRLTERFNLEFSAEAFNIFNHDQYADPEVNFSNGNFGQINSIVNFNSNNDSFAPDNVGSGTPRQFQFALRLQF